MISSVVQQARSGKRALDVRYAIAVVLVAGAYTGSGKLGLQWAFESHSVTAIWPPTGIALSALILGGYRMWPAVALGALFANIHTGVPAVTVLGITCGNTLEALVGAYLLRRFAGFRPDLQRVRDVLSLVVFGAVLSTTVSATVGVTSLLIGGATSWAHVSSLWRTWWLGDMGGDLIVAPVLLILAGERPLAALPGRWFEAVALAVTLGGVSVLVFNVTTGVVYVLFPLMTLAALRFWQLGAALASLLVATVAVGFTVNGSGPFAMYGMDDRLLLAQTFVAVAGVTVLILAAVTRERSQAQEAQHAIAETLQRSLLPDAVPPIEGWDIATLYRPVGAREVVVGGDFFDFFATDAGSIVMLGDVAGKGVEAAAMTALVRHGARFLSRAEPGPAAILARLDEALRERPALSLCSAICARLHGDQLVISSAGHPPVLIVRRDGRIREIAGGGPLLGAWEGHDWPQRTVSVGPDETVLLYTDGVTDTRGASERFGQERLRGLLVEHASRAPADLLAELESALQQFQRGPQNDDTAAIALRLDPARAGEPGAAPTPTPQRREISDGSPLAGAAPFNLRKVDTAGSCTVAVTGELDHRTSGQLLEEFERVCPTGCSELVVDLGAVAFVDTAGLRAIIEIERRARERGTRSKVVPPPEHVRAVFRLAGLEEHLERAGAHAREQAEPEYAERVQINLPAIDTAPRRARAEVREAINGKLPVRATEEAILLTSELVTNAVLHPANRVDQTIGLWIGADAGRVRVEIEDSGDGFDPEQPLAPRELGGLGLVVVDHGATRWGIQRGERFVVWFELATDE